MKTTLLIIAAFFLLSFGIGTEAHARNGIQVASWYGHAFEGRPMANGQIFRSDDPTIAAHRYLPLGTKAIVINLKNGKRIEVVITDRGPFVKGRTLDLSQEGAKQLGFEEEGVASVALLIVH